MKTWKENRKTINIVCTNCGIAFNKTLSEYKRNEKKNRMHFCSFSCSISYKKLAPKYCKNCNGLIGGYDNRTIFCSSNCAAIYNNKNRKGEKRNFSVIGKENIRNAVHIKHSLTEGFIEYCKSPNHCKECGVVLVFGKRKHVFCDINCKRIYDRKNITEYQKYYRNCQFNFSLSDYPNEFDFKLIEKYGWYKAKNHGDNLSGISRDHMISVKYGYENNISPKTIKHPANCELLLHSDNSSKQKNCSITLNDLLKKINNWNIKYDELPDIAR